ncbi:hypothetical protein GCM10010191_49900 [Actinomadura vinacea]|uniref:Uncharacterized protein n=1 Tax=Actinomadura vinacea TaxID=115336 RepID=A0ABP5WQA0_9ACTN
MATARPPRCRGQGAEKGGRLIPAHCRRFTNRDSAREPEPIGVIPPQPPFGLAAQHLVLVTHPKMAATTPLILQRNPGSQHGTRFRAGHGWPNFRCYGEAGCGHELSHGRFL